MANGNPTPTMPMTEKDEKNICYHQRGYKLYTRARQQAASEPLAALLCIKKNIFIVIKFKKKDIKLYLAAPEPPVMA